MLRDTESGGDAANHRRGPGVGITNAADKTEIGRGIGPRRTLPIPVPVSVILLTTYVAWSLPDAPGGITIDSDGSITVTATAALEADNDITVQAMYRGVSYTGILSITKMRLAEDGVPGLPGKDGVTYYTWIRYRFFGAGAQIFKKNHCNVKLPLR
jgi:hypothetical protein